MEWISVEDRLPNKNNYILATDGDLIAGTVLTYDEQKKHFTWDYFSSGCGCCDTWMENVTHWMPMPDLPKD